MGNNGENMQDQKRPEFGSGPLLEFLWSQDCDMRLFMLVIETVLQTDFVVHVARRALAGSDDYKSLKPLDLARKYPGKKTKALRQSNQELLEMFVTRIIDNFQTYLVEAIRSVLQKKPEILSGRKQELTVGQILKFATIDDLVLDIIESKINSLSYEGFGEIKQWCIDRGIPLAVPEESVERIVELISVRNIIIHNRGIVDSRFVTTNPKSPLKAGDKYELHADYLFNSIYLLNSIVFLTDSAINEKFKIVTRPIKSELKARLGTKYNSD